MVLYRLDLLVEEPRSSALAPGRETSAGWCSGRGGPPDPLTFVAVASLLILVALAARYLSAGRATRVDPMVALRAE